ncbi:MAG: hypothetical protein IJ105_00610 [Bacilli bacterium]|nr:hypothetical protein [Bacilli bacterium]
MSEKENIIVKYGKMYEDKLKSMDYKNSDVEKLLNVWIKRALTFLKENPQITNEELENYLLGKSNILK